MNENDFNDFDAVTRFQAYQAQRGYKKSVSVFFPFLKNNSNLTEATGSCSVRQVF